MRNLRGMLLILLGRESIQIKLVSILLGEITTD